MHPPSQDDHPLAVSINCSTRRCVDPLSAQHVSDGGSVVHHGAVKDRTAVFLVVIPLFAIVILLRGDLVTAAAITFGWILVSIWQWASHGWPFNRRRKS